MEVESSLMMIWISYGHSITKSASTLVQPLLRRCPEPFRNSTTSPRSNALTRESHTFQASCLSAIIVASTHAVALQAHTLNSILVHTVVRHATSQMDNLEIFSHTSL